MNEKTLKSQKQRDSFFKNQIVGRIGFATFRFFASLKLAIFLLVSLMIILATGTIIESLHGTQAARLAVYETRWFSILLIFLALNLAAAALDRIPWKRKHVGFVITHLGIIMILFGSLVTQQLMVDGQMAIEEGQTEHRITLPEPVLYVYSEELQADWLIPISPKPFVWKGKQALKVPQTHSKLSMDLQLLTYYPKALVEDKVTEAAEGAGALRVVVQNSFVNQELWLVQNDPEKGSLQLGPAKVIFTDTRLQASKETVLETGYLEFQFEKTNVRVPLKPEMSLPAQFDLEGTPYKFTIQKLFKNAVVQGKELIEQAENEKGEAVNPAAQLVLEGNGIRESHTVFAKFPDFPTMHGMKPSQVVSHLFYRMPNGGSRGESHELRFVQEGGELLYQVQDGFNVKTEKVKVGEETPLGWMDLHFKVETYYPHAKVEHRFEPIPSRSENERAVSTIEIGVQSEDISKKIWLGQGMMETVKMGSHTYHFLYGQRRMPAGFKLSLRDFRVENYPGTNQPASFESDVTLKDDMRGVVKDTTISMNEPLAYRGFHVYQSGYSLEPDQPEVSIFSVGKDPGIPLKYSGTIVMVLGIVTMFFTKRFSTNAGKIQ